MSTAPADERLSAYLDGELTDEEVAHLEAELARDAALRAQLSELEAVVRFLHDEGPVRAPLGFHSAVMARIEEEHPERAPWWAFFRRPFGVPLEGLAVAAAALIVVAVVGWPRGDEPLPGGEEPVWRDLPEEQAPAAVDVESLKKESMKGEAPAEPEAAPPAEVPSVSKKGGPKAEPAVPTVDEPEPTEAEAVAEGTDERGSDEIGRSVPRGYTVITEDTTALRTLLAVVGKLGGSVTLADGSEVQSAQMTSSTQGLKITLPTGALAEFERQLAGLGMLQRDFDDKLYYADQVTVGVTLQLAGGSVGGDDGSKPNAARARKQYEADMMEAEAPE
jgi:negative regulator of sigma E activity